jgi:glucose/arabinose dehydrogenase
VHRFVEGLARPTALAVLADGSLLIAEDRGRLLRLWRER